MIGGLSRPMLVACQDDSHEDMLIVLKLREAASGLTWGAASLACELVSSALARLAGLTVPDYAIVHVTKEFASSVPDMEARSELLKNIGENFGTIFQENCANYIPGSRVTNTEDQELETILAFDSFTMNPDRKEDKPNLLMQGDTLYLIDHSLAFPHLGSPSVNKPWNEWLPENQIQQHCTFKSYKNNPPVFSRFKEFLENKLTTEDCKSILDLVPDSWQRSSSNNHDSHINQSDKSTILNFLFERSSPFLTTEANRLIRICNP